ncbi:hypothetical protein CYMTET_33197, partial [Cymbomonas tetramitiformis]
MTGAGVVSLLGATIGLEPVARQIKVIAQVLWYTVPREALASSAHVTTFVLCRLYHLVSCAHYDPGTAAGGLAYAGLYHTVMRVLMGGLRPYITALDAWVNEGDVDDPYGEFMVEEKESLAVTEPGYWHRAFGLRTNSSGSAGAEVDKEEKLWPGFLDGVAPSILAAGKSLRLLQHRASRTVDGEGNPARCRGPPSTPLPGTHESANGTKEPRRSLYQRFCDSVDRELIGSAAPSGDPPSGSAPTISGHTKEDPSATSASPDMPLPSLEEERMTATLQAADAVDADVAVGGPDDSEGLGPRARPPATPALEELGALGTSTAGLPLPAGSLVAGSSKDAAHNALEAVERVLPQGTQVSPYERVLHKAVQPKRASAMPTLVQPSWDPTVETPGLGHFGSIRSSQPSELDPEAGVLGTLLPPPDVLMDRCLLQHIEAQVRDTGHLVSAKLASEWGLLRELRALRDIFLGGNVDILDFFYTEMFSQLRAGNACEDMHELMLLVEESVSCSVSRTFAAEALSVTAGGRGLYGGSSFTADADAQRASMAGRANKSLSAKNLELLGTTFTPLLDSEYDRSSEATYAGTAIMEAAPNMLPPASSPQPCDVDINAFLTLRLMYRLPWPLQMIVGHEEMEKYNRVHNFLMAVRRAKNELDHTVAPPGAPLFHMQLLNFVNNLLQFSLEGILIAAWKGFTKRLQEARTVDEIIAAHDYFLL